MEQHANKTAPTAAGLQCIGNVCCVLVYSQSVYSTQLCVHTEQWIHNFGLTPVLAQRLAVWSIPN